MLMRLTSMVEQSRLKCSVRGTCIRMVWGPSLLIIILSFLIQISPKLLQRDDEIPSKRGRTGNVWRQDPVIGFHPHSSRLQESGFVRCREPFRPSLHDGFYLEEKRGQSSVRLHSCVDRNGGRSLTTKGKIQQGLTQSRSKSKRVRVKIITAEWSQASVMNTVAVWSVNVE